MTNKAAIHTDRAPQAIGTYSQAVKVSHTVYLSGQIALVPETMTLNNASVESEIEQVLTNLGAVCGASGGSLQDLVKLTVYLTDLNHFPLVNEVMARHLQEPYPARAAIGIQSLPMGATVEIDGIMVI